MIALNLSPNFRLYLKFKVICFAFIFRTNSEWIICWCVFAALAFPSTFAWNIYRKLFVTEKIISSAIVIAVIKLYAISFTFLFVGVDEDVLR